MYKPQTLVFNTPIRIQHRSETTVNGAPDIAYVPETNIDYCNYKAFHGSESLRAGVLGVTDGGTITMWYNPALTVKDRVLLNDDPVLAYEVISEPENVEMRNLYMIAKIERVVNP